MGTFHEMQERTAILCSNFWEYDPPSTHPRQITFPKESTIKMKMTVYSPAGEAVAIQKDKGITAKPRDLIKFAQSGQIMVKAGRRDNNLCHKT